MISTSTLYRRGSYALLLLALLSPGLSSAQLQYCTASHTTSCNTSADYIQSFSTSGGTSNITNLNSGCNGNPGNYIYYSNQTATVTVGNTIAWSITNCPQFAENYGIWVDFNHNGSFTDAGEQVYMSTTTVGAGATITGAIAVPFTNAVGLTRLRIRCAFNTPQITSCNTYSYGETEDYNLMITSTASPCTTPPVAGNINAFPSVICASTPTTLILTGYTAGSLVQWQVTSGTSWANIPGATNAVLHLPTPTSGGFYRATVTCPGTTLSSTTAAFQVVLSPNPPCQDSVWPGDANYDHIVDMLDALAIGLAYNHVGPARAGATINWNAQFAMNWPTSFNTTSINNGVNLKHADCNGDSVVNTADVAAVQANYGLIHPRGSIINGAKITGLPDLMADLTGVNLVPGNMVTVPIILGASGAAVPKIYGIAATLQLQGVSLGAPAAMGFNTTWIGSASNTLSCAKAIGNNELHWAVSRTDGTNASGYGVLGTVSFMVPMGAGGNLTFHLQDVTLVDSFGNVLTDYNVVDQTAIIHPTGIALPGGSVTSAAIVPNPSHGAADLQLRLDKATDMEVAVTDMTGRKVWQRTLHTAAGASTLQLPGAELAPGIYLVSIRTSADGAYQVLQWVKR